MSNLSGPAIGAELCRSLGFENVMSLSIECSTEDTLTVTVKQFISRKQEHALIALLHKYEMKEMKDSPASIKLDAAPALPAVDKSYQQE